MTAISRHKIIAPKSGGGTDTALDSRVTNLENNEYKILYFETISASTGTITKPTGATILLDQFYSGGDAIVETLSNGQPTGQSPLTVGGSVVSVSSFDTSGNYTLSGTPSSFDVALVYIFKIKAVDYSNLNIANIMAMEDYNNPPTLAQVLASGNKTNQTNIESNNGLWYNSVFDDYIEFGGVNGGYYKDADGTFITDATSVDIDSPILTKQGTPIITGTLPATAGRIGYSNGTLNTLASSSGLTYNGTQLVNGSTSPLNTLPGVWNTITNGATGQAGFYTQNPNTGAIIHNILYESLTKFGGIARYNSTAAFTYAGTTVDKKNTLQIFGGPDQETPVVLTGTPIINLIGLTSTNIGSRLDSIGLRIDTLSTLHTANTNLFQVGSNLTFNGTSLNVGNATPLVTQDFNVAKSLAGVGAAVGFSITNTNSTGVVSNNFGESLNNRLTLAKYGSTSSQTVNGTFLNYQNTSVVASTAGGNFGGGNLYIQGSPIINLIGLTSTNMGTRLDSVGFKIDAINTLHTTNLNAFTVNGRSFFGGNTTSTAIIHIASGTTANAQLRLASGVAPTTPNDGDIWFDGTDIKMRVAGVTKTFTLI